MDRLTSITEESKKKLVEKYNAKIITIPFECFVINPWEFMEQIERLLDTKMTVVTRRMMKRQNVPRKMYADGIGLKIYRRCGWVPPKSDSNENKEFEIRRQFAQAHASSEAMEVLDRLCADYEDKYLGGRKKNGEHYA